MSYALDSTQTNPRLRDTDYNHFVVFDAFNVIACHDFEVRLSRAYAKTYKGASEILRWDMVYEALLEVPPDFGDAFRGNHEMDCTSCCCKAGINLSSSVGDSALGLMFSTSFLVDTRTEHYACSVWTLEAIKCIFCVISGSFLSEYVSPVGLKLYQTTSSFPESKCCARGSYPACSTWTSFQTHRSPAA